MVSEVLLYMYGCIVAFFYFIFLANGFCVVV